MAQTAIGPLPGMRIWPCVPFDTSAHPIDARIAAIEPVAHPPMKPICDLWPFQFCGAMLFRKSGCRFNGIRQNTDELAWNAPDHGHAPGALTESFTRHLRISGIRLAAPHIGFDTGRGHEAHEAHEANIMAEPALVTAPMTRRTADLHADDTTRRCLGECPQLGTIDLLVDDAASRGRIKAHRLWLAPFLPADRTYTSTRPRPTE